MLSGHHKESCNGTQQDVSPLTLRASAIPTVPFILAKWRVSQFTNDRGMILGKSKEMPASGRELRITFIVLLGLLSVVGWLSTPRYFGNCYEKHEFPERHSAGCARNDPGLLVAGNSVLWFNLGRGALTRSTTRSRLTHCAAGV